MRIGIVGAGAIGGWIAARLAKAGYRVNVLARGATLEAIRSRGILLTEQGQTSAAQVKVSADPAKLGPQDLVILAVKGPALPTVAGLVAALCDTNTAVLSAMNGIPWWYFHGMVDPLGGGALETVDQGGQISRQIPSSRVLGAVVHASCLVEKPGHIVHRNGNGLIIGEPGGGGSERLDRAVAALRVGGFDVSVAQLVQQDIWYKLWGNQTMNPISALTGATGDRILDDELVSDFVLRVMAEAAQVGGLIGCPIAESGEDRNLVTRKLGAFKTSMLQDVEAGRPLEIDALLSAPREIAAAVGVATPNMDALHGLTRLFASVQGLNS